MHRVQLWQLNNMDTINYAQSVFPAGSAAGLPQYYGMRNIAAIWKYLNDAAVSNVLVTQFKRIGVALGNLETTNTAGFQPLVLQGALAGSSVKNAWKSFIIDRLTQMGTTAQNFVTPRVAQVDQAHTAWVNAIVGPRVTNDDLLFSDIALERAGGDLANSDLQYSHMSDITY